MFENRFFEVDQLYLAPVKMEDASLVIRWLNNETNRLMGRNRSDVINKEAGAKILERMMSEEEAFLIYLRDGEKPIGFGGLSGLNLYNRTAELSITIGEANYRGRGYGGETVKLLLKHGFVNLNLESIYLSVYEYNAPAIRLYEKVGFRLAGKRRNAKIIANQKFDEIIMDIIAAEYFERYGNDELIKITK